MDYTWKFYRACLPDPRRKIQYFKKGETSADEPKTTVVTEWGSLYNDDRMEDILLWRYVDDVEYRTMP